MQDFFSPSFLVCVVQVSTPMVVHPEFLLHLTPRLLAHEHIYKKTVFIHQHLYEPEILP